MAALGNGTEPVVVDYCTLIRASDLSLGSRLRKRLARRSSHFVENDTGLSGCCLSKPCERSFGLFNHWLGQRNVPEIGRVALSFVNEPVELG